jgi:altronate dehydratase
MGPTDDVAMALAALGAGSRVEVESPGKNETEHVVLVEDIPLGHKFALRDIRKDQKVVKFGMEIGTALRDIPQGAWVGEHNLE